MLLTSPNWSDGWFEKSYDLMAQMEKAMRTKKMELPAGFKVVDSPGEKLIIGDRYWIQDGPPVILTRSQIDELKTIAGFRKISGQTNHIIRHENSKFNQDNPPPPPDGFAILEKGAVPIPGDMTMEMVNYEWRPFYGSSFELPNRPDLYIAFARSVQVPTEKIIDYPSFRLLKPEDTLIRGDEYLNQITMSWNLVPAGFGNLIKQFQGIIIRRPGPDPGPMFENVDCTDLMDSSYQQYYPGEGWSHCDYSEHSSIIGVFGRTLRSVRRLKNPGEGYRVISRNESLVLEGMQYLDSKDKWSDYESGTVYRVRNLVDGSGQKQIFRCKITEPRSGSIPNVIIELIRKNPNKDLVRGIVRANLKVILPEEAMAGGPNEILKFIQKYSDDRYLKKFGCLPPIYSQGVTTEVARECREEGLRIFSEHLFHEMKAEHELTISAVTTEMLSGSVRVSRNDRVERTYMVPEGAVVGGRSSVEKWIIAHHSRGEIQKETVGKLVFNETDISLEGTRLLQLRNTNFDEAIKEWKHRRMDNQQAL